MPEPTVKPDRPPVPDATPILSFSPVTLSAPGRLAPLEMRVVAPVTGSNLPVILFSHGHGASNFISSMRGYGPLVDYYAAHGFVVIIPTHLNSKTVDVDRSGPAGALFWRSRAEDMRFILDHLAEIEAAVPTLAGRIDPDRIAAVGHSLGGHTVAMLAGMRVKDSRSGEQVDLSDPRIRTAIMFSPPGDGADAAPALVERFPELVSNDFSHMTTPSLVVTGDKDVNLDFSTRPDWRADAFRLGPAPKWLLFLNGAGHMLGGISGYDAKETTDESPERVALIQRLTWGFLRSMLYVGENTWQLVSGELVRGGTEDGRVEAK